MKRPRLTAPKSVRSLGAAKAKTKKDAAVQLVVLEFGVSRLERELEHTQRRLNACQTELAQKTEQRQRLLSELGS
ncbi:MAG: hypothetical protein AAF331_15965 [Pseudomonadota bacterium]